MLPPVDPQVLSANPKFDALYRDLCTNKLNPDATAKLDAKAQKERDDVSKELKQARIKAAKAEVVKQGLSNIAYKARDLPSELQELVSVIVALLEGQFSREDYDILGDEVEKFKDNAKPIAAALSKQFQQDAEILTRIANPDSPPSIISLPSTITNLKTSASSLQAQVTTSRLNIADQAASLHALHRQVLQTSIRILEQTIHGSVSRATKAKADYLSLVAEGIAKKLSIQHSQLMAQVYNPEMQQALDERFVELERENRVLARKVAEAEEKLEEYGRESAMLGLAREYAEVKMEVERVRGEVGRLEGSLAD